MSAKRLKLGRPDLCVTCGDGLPVGAPGWWDPDARTVTCTGCWSRQHPEPRPAEKSPPAHVDRGQPGASLVREYERRRRNREQRTRDAHPHIGGVLLAIRATPQHELAFHQGAVAERAVARSLAHRTESHGVIILHNRLMPGGRGDIDHIAIAPSGVYVVDTKDWKGTVEIRSPIFGASKLLIAGRDCTTLIDGLERQIGAVRAALERIGRGEVRIQGALCFTKADLPLLMTQRFRGHLLLYRRALAKRLKAQGPLQPPTIEQVARGLAASLPPGR